MVMMRTSNSNARIMTFDFYLLLSSSSSGLCSVYLAFFFFFFFPLFDDSPEGEQVSGSELVSSLRDHLAHTFMDGSSLRIGVSQSTVQLLCFFSPLLFSPFFSPVPDEPPPDRRLVELS